MYNKTDPVVLLRDDSGNHISNRNPGYCELTVQYWAWKNLDCDVCGLMHRRRYFDFSEDTVMDAQSKKKNIKPYRIFDEPTNRILQKINVNDNAVAALTEKYQVIAAAGENIFTSVRNYYHKKDQQEFDDMSLITQIIAEQYPQYLEAAQRYLNGTYSYFCNMFIMEKTLFDHYSQWLFGIIEEYERRKPKEFFYPREQGKIAERLFGIYMTHIVNDTDIPWAEIPRAHFARIDGATPHNMSFNKIMYHLLPPGSLRKRMVSAFLA